MASDAHIQLTLRAIQEHASENGTAWWYQVEPSLEPAGVSSEIIEHLKMHGLIERSPEIGFLRLTPKGLRLVA